MGRILKDIYTDISLASLLGFKGGTCAYFFYKLPRFSVDLDFDLLKIDEVNKKLVFDKIIKILEKYGQVKNQYIKRYTIFALLSYGKDDHNIKVEINTRKLSININNHYQIKNYLGISIFVAKKDYLFAGKLLALSARKEMAMRDVYDIYFFAKNNWDINEDVIKEVGGKKIKEHLKYCVSFIENIKQNQVLQGMGEIIDNKKEKDWIKNHLKSETIFMLKNYISVLK